MPDDYLDVVGVARMLGVSASTLRAYRSRGQLGFPEPDITVGGRPGWKPSTIEKWNAARRGRGWRSLAVRTQQLLERLATGQSFDDAATEIGFTDAEAQAIQASAQEMGLLPTTTPRKRTSRRDKEA